MYNLILFLYLSCVCFVFAYSQDQSSSDIKAILKSKLDAHLPKKVTDIKRLPTSKKKIIFSYQDKDLADVIEQMAIYKKINIILPQDDRDAIKGKFTFSYPKKISIDEAWNIFITILENAGLILVPKGSMYIVTRKENASEAQVPLYINVNSDSLPDCDERIKYIYYFTNINLSVKDQSSSISTIIDDMLPSDEKGEKSSYVLDGTTNALMITTTSSRIKMIMSILKTFDESGFTEAVTVINLKHVDADFVEKLFIGDDKSKIKGLIAAEEAEQSFFPFQQEKKKAKKQKYFSESTRVVSIARINSIVIFGRQDSVDTVIDFINKYIDVPIESGTSIVHIKELNFIDAQSLATALGTLLEIEGQKQAKAEATTGKMYDFSSVLIQAEIPYQEKTPEEQTMEAAGQEKEKTEGAYLGGNRIIVASRGREWKVINDLIDMLDVLQSQVAIEGLVVDITSDDARALGMQLRNTLFPQLISQDINFQAAHLNKMWLDLDSSGNVKSPPGLAANLLGPMTKKAVKDTEKDTTTFITDGFLRGSTAVSFGEQQNDGKSAIWAILQMLNYYTTAHVLSRPFVVVSNNQKASLISEVVRRVGGEAAADTSGPIKVDRADIGAGFNMTIEPHIGVENEVGLTISIDVDEFKPGSDSKITRNIKTNAVVKDSQVLMLGGLDKLTESETRNETPGISKVPLAGWFFKKRSVGAKKQTLMVFIVPHILKPRLGGLSVYVSPFSKEKIDVTNQTVVEDKDPRANRDLINKAFFDPLLHGCKNEVDDFVQETLASDKQEKKVRKNKKRKSKNNSSESKSTNQLKEVISNKLNPLVK